MQEEQNQASENISHSRTMTFIASIGWILLVGAAGIFLLVGAPYYYQKGVDDKFEQDYQVVENWLRGDEIPGNPVIGRIQTIEDNRILLEVEALTPNPLAPERLETHKTILIDDNTKIVVETFQQPQNYLAELQRLRDLGRESEEEVFPFVTSEASLDDLYPSMGVSILPADGYTNFDNELVAKEIKYIVYLDPEGEPIVSDEGNIQ